MWKKLALLLSILLVITACSEGITSPNEVQNTNPPTVAQVDTNLTAMMSSLNLGSSIDSVYSTDEWFQRGLRWTRMGWVSCAGRTFVDATVNMHLRSLVVTLKDGNMYIFQYWTSTGGIVLDTNGNEYQYSENGGSTEYRAIDPTKEWIKGPNFYKLVPSVGGPTEYGYQAYSWTWNKATNSMVEVKNITVTCR